MQKKIVIPALALLGGAAGFFLRRWELATAFEPPEGGFQLAIPGAAASLALIGLSGAMCLILLLLCRGKHRAFPNGYDEAFAARGNTLYITVCVLAALLALGSAVLNFLTLPDAYAAARADYDSTHVSALLVLLPQALLAALSAGSFLCVLASARNNYRAGGKGQFSGTLLTPAYACCVWLITSYQARAGDPVRLSYVYELLGVICSLLGLYFIASFAFERPKPFLTSFFSALGIYFSLVTLADAHTLYIRLLYGFTALYLTASLAVLLSNDAGKEPRAVRKAPEITADDVDIELIKTEEPTDE